ncbi:MAG: DNA mismatch repair endonuclease MutL [Candidatus Schekmanbacteria bacterium]|nr:DNA mismatch repair endonuclease MutL [Candidatus Schekmanbacteria bacterium]
MIKILPDSVINKIAAGEVVERPASVIKELVENSIDAGSRAITVSVADGGKSLIKVMDDGCGMSEEEVLLAIQRHSTSKIESETDLERISTFGFRGEALPSIAAVSQLTIETNSSQGDMGCIVEIEGGNVIRRGKSGMPRGTSIEVRNLFFNMPARKKFLKSTQTEQNHIDEWMTKLALARNGIEFRYISNGKEVFRIPSSADLIEKTNIIFGNELADKLIEIEHSGEVSIKGLISVPHYSKPTRNFQYLFVNKRSVRDSGIYHAISRGYAEALQAGKHAIVFLFIETDPASVDANIHPSKQEVRFSDSGKVVGTVINAIRNTIGKNRNVRMVKLEHQPQTGDSDKAVDLFESYSFKTETELEQFLVKKESAFAQEDNEVFSVREVDSFTPRSFKFSSLEVVGQIRNSYIVAQSGESVYFIDQHAAHERALFEKIKESYFSKKASVQNLLIPVVVNLTRREKSIWEDNLESLEKLGLESQDFGEESIRITGVPAVLGTKNPENFLRSLIEKIESGSEKENPAFALNSMFQSLACHSAVRANDKLEPAELQNLLKLMDETEFSTYCPHGRNAVFKMDISKIEKLFDRR